MTQRGASENGYRRGAIGCKTQWDELYNIFLRSRGTSQASNAFFPQGGSPEDVLYAELVYFEGAYFAHIVTREEYLRLRRIHESRGKSRPCRRPMMMVAAAC